MRDSDSIRPRNRAVLRTWLERHHDSSTGVWVDYPKVRSGIAGLTYEEIVEEALCFGWIDSVVRKLDEPGRKSLRLTPRKAGSIWAKSNRERVERLIASGQMTPAGQRIVDAARQDGSWQLLVDVEAHVIAPDLDAALARHRGARRAFEAYPKSQIEQLLYWCYSAKRPETRAQRVQEVARAAAGKQK